MKTKRESSLSDFCGWMLSLTILGFFEGPREVFFSHKPTFLHVFLCGRRAILASTCSFWFCLVSFFCFCFLFSVFCFCLPKNHVPISPFSLSLLLPLPFPFPLPLPCQSDRYTNNPPHPLLKKNEFQSIEWVVKTNPTLLSTSLSLMSLLR